MKGAVPSRELQVHKLTPSRWSILLVRPPTPTNRRTEVLRSESWDLVLHRPAIPHECLEDSISLPRFLRLLRSLHVQFRTSRQERDWYSHCEFVIDSEWINGSDGRTSN